MWKRYFVSSFSVLCWSRKNFSFSRNVVTRTKFPPHAANVHVCVQKIRKKEPTKHIFLWVLRDRTGENDRGEGVKGPNWVISLPDFLHFIFPQLSCQLCVGGAVQSKPNFIKFHFLRTLSIAETSKTSPSILCTTFYLSEAVVSFQWKKWSTSPLWTTKDKEGWKSK